MADDIKKGDDVTWKSHGGQAEGTVVREITSDTEAAGRTVRADGEHPQYEVESSTSGGRAVHKPSALRRS
jgi:Hypervirulence associated proteins TUDOR domain